MCICYEVMTSIKLIHTSITWHSYRFFFFFLGVWVVRTLKTYSLSKFQVYSLVFNYSHHAIHDISRTYSSHDWNVVNFDQDLLISHTSNPWPLPFSSLVLWVRHFWSRHKWDHTALVSLCQAYFTSHNNLFHPGQGWGKAPCDWSMQIPRLQDAKPHGTHQRWTFMCSQK